MGRDTLLHYCQIARDPVFGVQLIALLVTRSVSKGVYRVFTGSWMTKHDHI